MFNLPRTVGKTDSGEEILADIGRFGPYVKIGAKYVSIKGHDPLLITESEAREAISDNADAAAKKVIADYGVVKILRGPYGPYITDGKKNARIAKDADPEKINEKEAKELLAKAPVGKKRFPKRKRS